MKLVAKILGIFFLSLLIGIGVALYQLKSVKSNNNYMLKNGCWQVNPKMDLKQNDWQRARIAIIGLFALRESEVLYFVASEDSDGERLSSEYDYELVGTAPNARYWSYTMYGEDYFLVSNEDKTYSFNLDDLSYVTRDTLNPELPIDGPKSYSIVISSNAKEGNWLPSGEEDQFHILLRMYNPAPEVYNNLEEVSLPIINKIEQ